MKLFLASSFDRVTDLFLEKVEFDLKGTKVLFIENAADAYDGDLKWGDKPHGWNVLLKNQFGTTLP